MRPAKIQTLLLAVLAVISIAPAFGQPGTRCTRINVRDPEQTRRFPDCKRLAETKEEFLPNRPASLRLVVVVSQSATTPAEVRLRALASDPDRDPLLYTWSTTGGRIRGDGADVVWELKGAQPGTYTVTAMVDDGCGCQSFESTSMVVDGPEGTGKLSGAK
jgi:hypothetical protein